MLIEHALKTQCSKQMLKWHVATDFRVHRNSSASRFKTNKRQNWTRKLLAHGSPHLYVRETGGGGPVRSSDTPSTPFHCLPRLTFALCVIPTLSRQQIRVLLIYLKLRIISILRVLDLDRLHKYLLLCTVVK